jgi:hypothetical protein
MRGVLWVAGVLVVLWGGWWLAGSVAIQRGVTAAMAEQAAMGKTAKGDVAVRGFPNRWDMTVTGLELGDPVSGILWQAPFVQVFAMTWKPWHLIAAFPPEQSLTLQGKKITVTAEGLLASLRTDAALDLPLAEARFAGTALQLASDQGWRFGLDEFTVALRSNPLPGPNSYELAFDLAPITPDPAVLAALKAVTVPNLPPADFPDTVESLWGSVFLTFTAPLDRHAGKAKPALTRVEIDIFNFAWGQLAGTAKGMVEADADGFASGRVQIKVTNWDRLPALLVAAGIIPPERAGLVAGAMRALAAQTPEPTVLSLALDMKDGRMSLGPFPLGPAPRLKPPQS